MNQFLRTDSLLDKPIRIFPDQESASRVAARVLAGWLDSVPRPLLATATGDSPTLAYGHLVAEAKSVPGRFAGLRLLKLDEWGGLDLDDPATCEHYLQRHLVIPFSLATDRYIAFDSNPEDPVAECSRIAAWVSKEGPIDVCVLGLGRNGHLAMNEPGTDPDQRCHVAKLESSTLSHPMLCVARRRPAYGLTLGLTEILTARTILLLVFGEAKADPLARFLSGPVSADFPASWLRHHPNVTVICDEAAAFKYKLRQQSPETSP